MNSSNQVISVSLSPDQWNLVGSGLGKLPLEVSIATFLEIQQQVRAALSPASAPEPATSPKAE